MKKLLMILSLATIFNCAIDTDTTPETTVPPSTSDDSVADDLAWFDVIEQLFYYPSDPNQPNGSYVGYLDAENNRRGVPFVERDDANNLVGAEIGKVTEANKIHVNNYAFVVKNGYTIKVEPGSAMKNENWCNNISGYTIYGGDELNGYGISVMGMIESDNVPIGGEIAILNVYDNPECTGEPLEVFKLVL